MGHIRANKEISLSVQELAGFISLHPTVESLVCLSHNLIISDPSHLTLYIYFKETVSLCSGQLLFLSLQLQFLPDA